MPASCWSKEHCKTFDKVIHIRARHMEELNVTAAPTQSHDFQQMSEHLTSPGDSQPPKDWWLANACRIAAFRLRQANYLSANVMRLRDQVRDRVEFIRIVWEEIERSLRDDQT